MDGSKEYNAKWNKPEKHKYHTIALILEFKKQTNKKKPNEQRGKKRERDKPKKQDSWGARLAQSSGACDSGARSCKLEEKKTLCPIRCRDYLKVKSSNKPTDS